MSTTAKKRATGKQIAPKNIAKKRTIPVLETPPENAAAVPARTSIVPAISVAGAYSDFHTSVDVDDCRFPGEYRGITAECEVLLDVGSRFHASTLVTVGFKRFTWPAGAGAEFVNLPHSEGFTIERVYPEDLEALGVLFTKLAEQMKADGVFGHIALGAK